MKAAEALIDSNCIAGGQAYNISDENPIEPYEFIRLHFLSHDFFLFKCLFQAVVHCFKKSNAMDSVTSRSCVCSCLFFRSFALFDWN